MSLQEIYQKKLDEMMKRGDSAEQIEQEFDAMIRINNVVILATA